MTAETAANGIDLIRKEHPDLVVLDVGLPDMDGREVCKHLRKQHFKKPILMLTANSTDADQILGFNSGANDYITKPFNFAVLLARIRVHLRQHEQSEDAVFAIGPYSFKPAEKVLFCQRGSKIRLTEKETLMLKRLHGASGKVVSREELMREVWGTNSDAASRTLDTHIYRLRQKIEKKSSRPELLVTEDGGYKARSERQSNMTLGGRAHEFWTMSARKLVAGCITDFGRRASWAVERAWVAESTGCGK